jgi:phosphoribosyl 1,2-cyclic phosphodiesterase
MSEFTATFWGVRGGFPVPGQGTLEFGGNTTCLEVRAGSHLIIVDAGTGIIGLGEKLMAQHAQDNEPIVGTLLFTHGHHDHTQGLSFFTPLRQHDTILHVFGPRVFGEDLADMLQRAVLPAMTPVAQRAMPGMRTIQNVFGDQVIVITERGKLPVVADVGSEMVQAPPSAVKIWVYHSSNHPKGGSLCYMVEYQDKRLVFATDTEGYVGSDTLLGRFVDHADVLIHDAEYTDEEYSRMQGYGHSTWKMAVAVGKSAQVKRLLLTHHHSRHDDTFLREMEEQVQAALPQASMAREGMTLEL